MTDQRHRDRDCLKLLAQASRHGDDDGLQGQHGLSSCLGGRIAGDLQVGIWRIKQVQALVSRGMGSTPRQRAGVYLAHRGHCQLPDQLVHEQMQADAMLTT